ncbi:cyclic AMP-dependent transcription factor ATF-7a isoform X9 [Syngnathoides biaculeatus]|nr:cyclic AMP-dependent transcription factor ATF-7a isoform X9 [Syngnathoides biaculeatus]XP_061661599.1 cyclic AMP-dependent transcription factor ATF-7a isoform X9 [Syngnathoides biaculeatus]XP_061661609.1 cyclic AMP-dependent transcription factor ATF-7a isoform X9 [Syngnathoides biaculeatus]
MTLKFTPRTDSVIIADQTPTPTRFLKNCEEVGLFNDLANSFEQDDDDNKQAKNSLPADSSVALDMSLQTPSDVKVKEETPVAVDSSAPDSPDSISVTPEGRKEHLVKDIPPRSSAPTPTIVRPGSLPLHLGFDALQPTMPSPTSVITQAPPSNRTLGSPTSHYSMMMLPSGQAVPVLPGPVQMQSVINLARPMCMVPNIPGIPGPPLGSNSSGSNSPSGYSIHCDAKMRLKAALSQQSPSGHSVAMMAMGNSPMVPQRAEQSQLLVQHPDAPSPAQPQVSPAQPTGGRRRRTADDDPDERRQRFLERNRAAASRCRQKRKLWVNSLEKKAEELSTLNVSLSFGVYRASFLMTTGIGSITPTSFNEVSLLRNEVAHLKQLLLAHKDCPVTTLQKKSAYLVAVDESMKDTSEPTGSPAPVIQHSSLAPSPSAGHNGLSSRAAAEAMAMSVLAGLGQQQNVESGASHIIMATHSQSSAR